MLGKYAAVLICKGVEYKTSINGSMHSDDELTFYINGIKISVEYDGNLYIENYDNYEDEQLILLSFYKKNDALFLTHYCFTFNIPITVVNKKTNGVNTTFITVEMQHDGTESTSVHYLFQLLNVKSTKQDIQYAIKDLQSQLMDLYIIHICECCRYGQDNPYGGDVYLNYLCFKRKKNEYLQFPNGVGKEDWEFFTDKKNIESTRPIYSCEEFEPYPAV